MNPPDNRRLPVSPKEWLIHAESDLKFGKLGMANGDILCHQICFHAQQAAEKAFKAVLLSKGIDFPLTHDIQELLDIIEEGGLVLSLDILDSSSLTPYAVEARYPGYWGNITQKEVEEAIELAQKVVTWAQNEI
ncbi:MAG: HEPN domain-containing protein [Candidatus Latescibacter sp.]|nr:HEPN domain-containing protein [Candidatus Latescibacter sp.]